MWETQLDPWVGKIPWRRAWQPTPVSLPGESHGQRSLAGYSPRGRKELDPTEWPTLSLRFFSCRILVSWPGTELQPPTLEAWSLNYWTTRDVPYAHPLWESSLPPKGSSSQGLWLTCIPSLCERPSFHLPGTGPALGFGSHLVVLRTNGPSCLPLRHPLTVSQDCSDSTGKSLIIWCSPGASQTRRSLVWGSPATLSVSLLASNFFMSKTVSHLLCTICHLVLV